MPGPESTAFRPVALTKREREILRALVAGASNKEIAAGLGTSAHTVKNQLTTLFRKTGVTTRVRLVAWAHRWAPEAFDE